MSFHLMENQSRTKAHVILRPDLWSRDVVPLHFPNCENCQNMSVRDGSVRAELKGNYARSVALFLYGDPPIVLECIFSEVGERAICGARSSEFVSQCRKACFLQDELWDTRSDSLVLQGWFLDKRRRVEGRGPPLSA